MNFWLGKFLSATPGIYWYQQPLNSSVQHYKIIFYRTCYFSTNDSQLVALSSIKIFTGVAILEPGGVRTFLSDLAILVGWFTGHAHSGIPWKLNGAAS
jgi:hypothetical protein